MNINRILVSCMIKSAAKEETGTTDTEPAWSKIIGELKAEFKPGKYTPTKELPVQNLRDLQLTPKQISLAEEALSFRNDPRRYQAYMAAFKQRGDINKLTVPQIQALNAIARDERVGELKKPERVDKRSWWKKGWDKVTSPFKEINLLELQRFENMTKSDEGMNALAYLYMKAKAKGVSPSPKQLKYFTDMGYSEDEASKAATTLEYLSQREGSSSAGESAKDILEEAHKSDMSRYLGAGGRGLSQIEEWFSRLKENPKAAMIDIKGQVNEFAKNPAKYWGSLNSAQKMGLIVGGGLALGAGALGLNTISRVFGGKGRRKGALTGMRGQYTPLPPKRYDLPMRMYS